MKHALGALIFCEKKTNALKILEALTIFSQNNFVKKNQRLKDSRGVDFFFTKHFCEKKTNALKILEALTFFSQNNFVKKKPTP